MSATLDNVIWSALTSRQAPLAIGGAQARRFPPTHAPFGATIDSSSESFGRLARLVLPEEEIGMFTVKPVPPTPAFEVTAAKELLQMIAPSIAIAPSRSEMIPLGAGDNADMQAIAEATRPGPFGSHTRELGNFFGVRVGGQLVAMAGERMHLDGYREISAVCVRPEFRGRGYARDLVVAVAQGVLARGEIPLLHVYTDNYGAIALYESLGFRVRAPMWVTRLRRTASAPLSI